MQQKLRTSSLFPLFLVAVTPVHAATEPSNPVSQPSFVSGDSWVFDDAHQRGASGYSQNRIDVIIERVDSDMMVVGGKIDGSPANYTDSMVGLDWSKRVTIDGNQVVTTRPFSFPLSVGSTWSTDYSSPSPVGIQKTARFHSTYKVIGWEDITVPAGSFRALKVEAHGTGEAVDQIPGVALGAAVSNGSGATGVTHIQRPAIRNVHITTYGAAYYVPEIKYWVKNIQEQYNDNNVLLRRDTQALVSFKPAN